MKATITLLPGNPNQTREAMARLWCEVLKPALRDGRRMHVTVKPETRSLAQNDMLWSILTDLSKQCEWVVDGDKVKLPPEDVKHILTAALKRHQRQARGIDGGLVILGQSTSRMTVGEMSELITLGHAVGDDRGVRWSRTSLGRDVPDEVAA